MQSFVLLLIFSFSTKIPCLTTECLLTARDKKTSALFPLSDFTLQYYPMLARDVKEIFFWIYIIFRIPPDEAPIMGAILSWLTSFDVYFLSQGIDREGRFTGRAFSLLSQHLHVRN